MLGTALPLVEHLDTQIEKYRGAEQGLNLLTSGGADLAQSTASVTDHNALLRIALHDKGGVYGEQRLVRGSVVTKSHFFHSDGDGVRQFVTYALQSGFADQLSDERFLGLVADLAVGIQ